MPFDDQDFAEIFFVAEQIVEQAGGVVAHVNFVWLAVTTCWRGRLLSIRTSANRHGGKVRSKQAFRDDVDSARCIFSHLDQ
jgi:hypothetical protein